MRVRQAVKHFTLLSMVAVAVCACSSTQEIEEKPAKVPVVLEPIIEEAEEEVVVSKVINNGVIDIPILENAQVFAEFTDKLPAVINYFTQSSEMTVIDFYQQAFGEPYSQDRKRGRLTLHYQEGEEVMRVVISQQNKKRQVDVIIENKN